MSDSEIFEPGTMVSNVETGQLWIVVEDYGNGWIKASYVGLLSSEDVFIRDAEVVMTAAELRADIPFPDE